MSAWGKYDGPEAVLPLEDHMADVALCFQALLALPLFRARLEGAMGRVLDPVTEARLAVLTFLHDLGKLGTRFQAKATDPTIRVGHAVQGWHVLAPDEQSEPVGRALGLPEIASWGPAVPSLALAVFAHHGRPIDARIAPVQTDWLATADYDPARAAATVGARCRALFPRAFEPGPDLPEAPEVQHFLAGLVALADQIGSREVDFPVRRDRHPRDPVDLLRAIRVDVADFRAALQQPAPAALFGWPEGAGPREMQQALRDLPLDIRLTVLEAETGSGKTEAAFLRFQRLFSAGLVDGLYFAVPTRAAASQIHGRIDRATRAICGVEAIQALPGYLKAGEARGTLLPHWQVEWEDAPDLAAREARWSAETPRRFLAAPVAVGTVDQVMLAGLKVKWAHFRASALARSYLVIDEVHASDAYMIEVVSRIVQDHVARGGHTLLMSATLGAAARARLLAGARARHDPVAAYPALSWPEGAGEAHAVLPGPAAGKTVAVSAEPIIAEPQQIARAALTAAGQGARVLVIRNTVDQVVAVQKALEELGGARRVLQVNGIPAPHHGRYAAEDRVLLDRAVEAAMGKGAAAGGRIVCGSQTLEQSLDIDADFLISDLCPIDVLLQRIGRLHRHRRSDRPAGFSAPRCLVAVPEVLRPDGVLLGFGLGANREGGGVYPDIVGLEAVRRLIGTGTSWTIPADNRRLVETGTDPATLDRLACELGEDWQAARNRKLGAELAMGQAGRGHLIDRGRPFDGVTERFPEDEKILTRIGADRLQLPIAPPLVGPFGQAVSVISVPGRWRGPALDVATGAEWVCDGAALVFEAARLRYDRFGLHLLTLDR